MSITSQNKSVTGTNPLFYYHLLYYDKSLRIASRTLHYYITTFKLKLPLRVDEGFVNVKQMMSDVKVLLALCITKESRWYEYYHGRIILPWYYVCINVGY